MNLARASGVPGPGVILLARMSRRSSVLEWGFFAVSLVLAALLTTTATSSFLAARRLTEVLVQGEAESMWHRLREALPRGRPPTTDELTAAAEPLVPEGLRHVALERDDGPGF